MPEKTLCKLKFSSPLENKAAALALASASEALQKEYIFLNGERKAHSNLSYFTQIFNVKIRLSHFFLKIKIDHFTLTFKQFLHMRVKTNFNDPQISLFAF